MTKFAVRVNGTGCLVRIQDRPQGLLRRFRKSSEKKTPAKVERCGFFTTRFVETNSSQEATERVVDMVQKELKDMLANPPDQPCDVLVEKVWEDPEQFATHAPGGGFTWYTEDS